MGRGKRGGSEPGAGRVGAPAGGPKGPRRPAAPAVRRAAPGRGENRPASSLVHSPKESTPSLRVRRDDIGRMFLYRPILGRGVTPPVTFGPRSTDRLSDRAGRKIKGAALKAHALKLGMRTFMTFTCAPEDRERIAGGSLVLGREMRRTLNAIQQRFRREGYRCFVYIWVAENPRDENPHVHLVTNYRVARGEFAEFAAWVESVWGHGWVKIERIRKPERAGHYILKAVRYAVKGAEGEQGTVRGNRYGISRNIQIVESTSDFDDREAAAATLCALTAGVDEVEGIEPFGGLWLTRYGLAFPAASSLAEVERVIDDLGEGALPD